jgi:hypothetical protein
MPCHFLTSAQYITTGRFEVFPQPVWSVSREWQTLLVADSGTVVLHISAAYLSCMSNNLLSLYQLLHHCVNASLLNYITADACTLSSSDDLMRPLWAETSHLKLHDSAILLFITEPLN